MQRKKNPLNDLERYRGIFFLIGMVLTLGAVIYLFNFKVYDDPVIQLDTEMYQLEGAEDVIPITIREPPKKVSAPMIMPEQIEIIDDAVEVDDEFEFSTTETDEDEAITNKTYAVSDGPVQSIDSEYEEIEEPLAFAVVESVPVFPGCEKERGLEAQKECFKKSILAYVGQNFEYAEEARFSEVSGRIFVQFVIEKNGQTNNVLIVRGLDPILDNEAIRVVKSLPKMTPAKQRGRPVRMSFVLPIKMVLE